MDAPWYRGKEKRDWISKYPCFDIQIRVFGNQLEKAIHDLNKALLLLLFAVYIYVYSAIDHSRVLLCLCFKASLSAKPFWWKWLICMRMKLHAELIFIWKVSHLDSFWNRGTRERGSGLFNSVPEFSKHSTCTGYNFVLSSNFSDEFCEPIV